VRRRGDLGHTAIELPERNVAIAVLHNAIHPRHALAALAAARALDVITPEDRQDRMIEIASGTVLKLAGENAVHVDDRGRAVLVTVTSASWLGPRQDGAAIDFAAAVRQDGRLNGHTVTEPYCVVEHGRIRSLSGKPLVTIGMRVIGAT
jgi:hypothetical protein